MSHGMPNAVSLRLKWLHRAVHCSCLCLTRVKRSSVRAVPHARAQLRHLALPDPSVRGKRHESAMDSAMRPWPPSADPHLWENASGRQAAAPLPPSAQLSFSSVWREARLSVPGAHVSLQQAGARILCRCLMMPRSRWPRVQTCPYRYVSLVMSCWSPFLLGSSPDVPLITRESSP